VAKNDVTECGIVFDHETHAIHPACALWPKLSDAEYADLVADIKKNGLDKPIVMISDKAHPVEKLILDGRHRHLACLDAGVEPRAVWYNGKDPFGYALTQNIYRRHLSKATRAGLIVKALALAAGGSDFPKSGKSKPRQHRSTGKPRGGSEKGLRGKAVAIAKKHGIGKTAIDNALYGKRKPKTKAKGQRVTCPHCGKSFTL
jgi:hypothetical protein